MQPAMTSTRKHLHPRPRRHRPDLVMYATVAFLWVAVWRFQDLWSILGKLQLPIILEITLAIAVAISMRGERSLKWTRSRIFGIPFLLLALMLAGVPFSLWLGKSVIFITKVFMPILLLMVGVIVSVREADDLNWIAFAHLIGAFVYALWTYLFVSVASDGRLSGGVHYDANDIALLLVSSLPFAIYFLRPKVALWKRLFAALSLVLFIEVILKSGSRGGFIALIVVALFVVLRYNSIPKRVRLFSVAAAVVMMTLFSSAAYWTMMQSIAHPTDDYNMTSPVGRKAIWKRGVGYMLSHPLLGVGANDFEQAEGSLSDISKVYAMEHKGLKWSTAHNSFVLVGAELGIPGLILFVTMIGTALYRLSHIKSEDDPTISPEDIAFAQTITGSLIGFCVAGFFVSAAYFPLLYVLIGLVVAEESFRRRRHARAPSFESTTQVVRSPLQPKRLPRPHWVPAG